MFDMNGRLDCETLSEKAFIATVSKEYVKDQLSLTISGEISPDKNYVLLPKHLEKRKENIKQASNEAMYGGFNEINDVLFYEKSMFKPLVPSIYLKYGNRPKNVVFFVKPSESLDNSYFVYEGSVAEAQKYYEDVVEMYGGVPYLNIESVSEQYYVEKAYFIQKVLAMLPLFSAIVLVLLLSTYQLAILNVAVNEKNMPS